MAKFVKIKHSLGEAMIDVERLTGAERSRGGALWQIWVDDRTYIVRDFVFDELMRVAGFETVTAEDYSSPELPW